MKINLFLKNIKENKEFDDCIMNDIDFQDYDFSSSFYNNCQFKTNCGVGKFSHSDKGIPSNNFNMNRKWL